MKVMITDIHPDSRIFKRYYNDFIGKVGRFEVDNQYGDSDFDEGTIYFDKPFYSKVVTKIIDQWGFCGIKYKVLEE